MWFCWWRREEVRSWVGGLLLREAIDHEDHGKIWDIEQNDRRSPKPSSMHGPKAKDQPCKSKGPHTSLRKPLPFTQQVLVGGWCEPVSVFREKSRQSVLWQSLYFNRTWNILSPSLNQSTNNWKRERKKEGEKRKEGRNEGRKENF